MKQDLEHSLQTRGFKKLMPRGDLLRMNRLFVPDHSDAIQVEVVLAANHQAYVSVFEMMYRSKRARRIADVPHYLVQGWGNSGNGQNPAFNIKFSTFGDDELTALLKIVDSGIEIAEGRVADRNQQHAEWLKNKPDGWDGWTPAEQRRWSMDEFHKRIAARKAANEGSSDV